MMTFIDTSNHCEGCRFRNELIERLRADNESLRSQNEILKKAILNMLGDQPYLATEAVEACEHLRDALRKCDA